MPDIFISYSRHDKAFVKVLHDALVVSKYETWIDWQDIAPTTEWWKEIEVGIETAHTFIFVISKDSVASEYCHKEIDHAVKHGKRLVPILRKKDFIQSEIHPKLGQHQWLSFQEGEDFKEAFSSLVQTINNDLDYQKAHTRLQIRAIEWSQRSRDSSLLLRGSELNRAEQWLLQASGEKEPKPTELQAGYIAASRKGETYQQQIVIGALSGLLILATSAGIWAWIQQEKAFKEGVNFQVLAESLTMEAYLASGLEEEAVAQAMLTGQALQGRQADYLQPTTQFRAIAAIREVLDGVKERGRLVSHQAAVLAVAFSPNGQIIATTSGDGTIKLWNQQGEELKTLQGHGGAISSVNFSPDGQTFVTAGVDKTAKIWNINGEVIQTFQGHNTIIHDVTFSPNGQVIATASGDKAVKLWNYQGEELTSLLGHKESVYSVAFSPDGQTIATASGDRTVKLWNLEGKEIHTLEGHNDIINSVVFSPDGQTLITASHDATTKIWNLKGEIINTLNGHHTWVTDAVFSPDGQTIATSSSDSTVKLWSREGENLGTIRAHRMGVLNLAFSPDGKVLATASQDSTAKLWDWQKEAWQSLKGHNGSVFRLTFSPDSQIIATSSDDQTAKLWDLQGNEMQTLKGHDRAIWDVSFSPDGQTIATASGDQTVRLWDQQGKELQTLRGHSNAVLKVEFSPDGQTIATASWDNTIKLWNRQGEELKTLSGHRSAVLDLAFSSDGQTIASGSQDSTAKLWNLKGEQLVTLKGHRVAVMGVAFSPDGEIIATASGDGLIKLWSKQGEEIQTLQGHSSGVSSVAFSPDGQIIATAGDQTVKLWSRHGDQLQTLGDQRSNMVDVTFSPDGRILAASSMGGTAKLWNFWTEDLIYRGCNWLGTYFTKQLPELLMELEVCQNKNPDFTREATSSLIIKGDELTRKKNVRQATRLYNQALIWNNEISFNPKDRVKKIIEFEEGVQLIEEGNIESAIEKFYAVQALQPPLQQSLAEVDRSWNLLCWQGSLQGYAAEVMFACDNVSALFASNYSFLNSRGLARALTDDTKGAIEDLKAFVAVTLDASVKAQYQECIYTLEQGVNPFTSDVLESLREEQF